jgi:VRR-NUC domain
MKTKNKQTKSESEVTGPIRLAFQKLGVILHRNNVGMLKDAFGRLVTFGLCKGSTDFIGWYSYVIKPKDVGRRIAIFTAPEFKREAGGRVSQDQANFIEQVRTAGGIAGVCKKPEDAEKLIEEFNNRGAT